MVIQSSSPTTRLSLQVAPEHCPAARPPPSITKLPLRSTRPILKLSRLAELGVRGWKCGTGGGYCEEALGQAVADRVLEMAHVYLLTPHSGQKTEQLL